MINQEIPECRTCGKEASIAGQIFTTVAEIMEIDTKEGYLCGNCFKTAREAEKDYIADQGFLREEAYESEQEYWRSKARD